MSALQLDLENAINQALDNAILLEDVYIGQTADGLVVATEHAKVLNPIPFRINAKIGGLDYDVFDEIQAFKIELQEKAEKNKNLKKIRLLKKYFFFWKSIDKKLKNYGIIYIERKRRGVKICV